MRLKLLIQFNMIYFLSFHPNFCIVQGKSEIELFLCKSVDAFFYGFFFLITCQSSYIHCKCFPGETCQQAVFICLFIRLLRILVLFQGSHLIRSIKTHTQNQKTETVFGIQGVEKIFYSLG